jgi:type IV secretion system protein VirB10
MTDEETGFEFSEDGREGREQPEGDDFQFSEDGGEDDTPEKEAPETHTEKDARKAVRLNKAPWINRRLIFMTLAAAAAVTMLISIVSPGKGGGKKDTARTRNAPDVGVPDFGDYQGRAYRAGEASYPEDTQYDPSGETLPPYSPPPPQQRPPPPPPQAAGSPSQGRNPAAEAEYAARESSLVPRIQGRLLGMPSEGMAEYAMDTAQYPGAVLSPEDYMRSRLSALGDGAGLYGTGSPAAPAPGNGGNSYQAQNMQEDKQAFYSEGRDETVSGTFIGEDTVWNGTIIPAVLITGINTDLPGDVQARVTANVYDSLTGKKLLIPQGSILIATYNSSVSFAQARVQIAWNTLIRPDGYQVTLGNMNAVDRRGFSGTRGQINDHLFQYVKAAGIISAFTLLNGEIAYSGAAVTNPSLQNLIATNQGVVNQLSAGIINRALDIQPTLRVKNGTQINVMVNKNIRLPPLEDYKTAGIYRRK